MKVDCAWNAPPILNLGAGDQGTGFPEFFFDPEFREINSLCKSFRFPAGHKRAAVGTGDGSVTAFGAACAAPGLTLFYHLSSQINR